MFPSLEHASVSHPLKSRDSHCTLASREEGRTNSPVSIVDVAELLKCALQQVLVIGLGGGEEALVCASAPSQQVSWRGGAHGPRLCMRGSAHSNCAWPAS